MNTKQYTKNIPFEMPPD